MSTDAVLSQLSRESLTLAQWCEEFGHTAQRHPSGATFLTLSPMPGEVERWELFHLTDFAVMSVSGPVYWLARKSPKCHQCGQPATVFETESADREGRPIVCAFCCRPGDSRNVPTDAQLAALADELANESR